MLLAIFGPIGTPELVVILIVALLIFGKRLPEVMRALGKSVNEFKRGMNEVTDTTSAPPTATPTTTDKMMTAGQDVSAPPGPPAGTQDPIKDSPQKTL